MTPAEFARAVDRIRYSPWCPTCGRTRVRWAGCSNAWHAIHAERMFPVYNGQNITDPAVRLTGKLAAGRVLDTEPVGGPHV